MKKLLSKTLWLCTAIIFCFAMFLGCSNKPIPPITAEVFKDALQRVEDRDALNTARVEINDFQTDQSLVKSTSFMRFYFQDNKTYYSTQSYNATTDVHSNDPTEYYITENDEIFSVKWNNQQGCWVKEKTANDKGHQMFETNIMPFLEYKNSFDKFEQLFQYDDKGKVVESNMADIVLLPQYYSEFIESVEIFLDPDNITSITYVIFTDVDTLIPVLSDIIILYDQHEEDETVYQRQLVINFSESYEDIIIPEEGSENRYA